MHFFKKTIDTLERVLYNNKCKIKKEVKHHGIHNLQNGYMMKQTLILEQLFNVIIKMLELTTEYMK